MLHIPNKRLRGLRAACRPQQRSPQRPTSPVSTASHLEGQCCLQACWWVLSSLIRTVPPYGGLCHQIGVGLGAYGNLTSAICNFVIHQEQNTNMQLPFAPHLASNACACISHISCHLFSTSCMMVVSTTLKSCKV